MSAPQLLVQAMVNRLASRLGSGLADVATSLAVLAREAPEKLQQDWELFWEEVQLEADRLDAEGGAAGAAAAGTWTAAASASGPVASGATAAGSQADAIPTDTPWASSAAGPSAQEQIDQLRALVAGIARRLEEST